MFCPDGANVGSWKLVVERIVEHLQCVLISGSPNYLNIMGANSTSRLPYCDWHF